MSSPTEPTPFAATSQWYGQQPLPPQPLQPNPPPYWQPYPPAPKQTNGLALAALVVGSLALVLGLGFVVFQFFFGMVVAGVMGGSGMFDPSAAGMEGTAPQVVTGRPYPGAMLEDEVTRVVRRDIGDVTSMSCPVTSAVVADARVECHAVVDGSDWTFRVTFGDSLGHFTLDEKVD